jgi:ankyrin repeat protein
MLASMNGHTQAVKLLLDMGSDINAQVSTTPTNSYHRKIGQDAIVCMLMCYCDFSPNSFHLLPEIGFDGIVLSVSD